MEAQHPDAGRELHVGAGDKAAVAEPEEVLRREEAEGGGDAGGRDPLGAEGLGGVLDQRLTELRELRERRGASEQVHRHDRLRPPRDPCGHVLDVQVQRLRVDLREDRRGAAPRDRLRRGVERERRADHLVAGADPHRVEHEHERVGAVGDADRLGDAEVARRLLLERLHVRTEDELPGFEHLRERGLQARDEWRVLRLDVNEWDLRLHDAPV
jgi:hypothetical protein